MRSSMQRLNHAVVLLLLLGATSCSKPALENNPAAVETAPAPPSAAVEAPPMPTPGPEAPATAPVEVVPPMAASTTEDWLIVPGERVGAITASSSEAEPMALRM